MGIDLDLDKEIEVLINNKLSGKLLKMNAEKLKFCENYFDLIITISTFEHFLNPKKVLDEMYRVLKKGGSALVTFGPLWTSSYGYHLHQLPEVAKYIPKWSHLICNKNQMTDLLINKKFPDGLGMSLNQVIDWIYKNRDINRINIREMKDYFLKCKLKIEWIVPLYDDDSDDKKIISKYLSSILPYTDEELMTKGFSILLNKS